MSENNFLNASVLRLTEKIDQFRAETSNDLTEIKVRLSKVEIAIDSHSESDKTAQREVIKLDRRVVKLEKPYKWVVWTLAGVGVILGSLTSFVSIASFFKSIF